MVAGGGGSWRNRRSRSMGGKKDSFDE